MHYVRSTFLRGDETVMHLFEAPSAEAVRRVLQRVALPHERIVEALDREPAVAGRAGSRSPR